MFAKYCIIKKFACQKKRCRGIYNRWFGLRFERLFEHYLKHNMLISVNEVAVAYSLPNVTTAIKSEF